MPDSKITIPNVPISLDGTNDLAADVLSKGASTIFRFRNVPDRTIFLFENNEGATVIVNVFQPTLFLDDRSVEAKHSDAQTGVNNGDSMIIGPWNKTYHFPGYQRGIRTEYVEFTFKNSSQVDIEVTNASTKFHVFYFGADGTIAV